MLLQLHDRVCACKLSLFAPISLLCRSHSFVIFMILALICGKIPFLTVAVCLSCYCGLLSLGPIYLRLTILKRICFCNNQKVDTFFEVSQRFSRRYIFHLCRTDFTILLGFLSYFLNWILVLYCVCEMLEKQFQICRIFLPKIALFDFWKHLLVLLL